MIPITDLIGAAVKISKVGSRTSWARIDTSKTYTISQIQARVLDDGRIIPIVTLAGLENLNFLFTDLQIRQ